MNLFSFLVNQHIDIVSQAFHVYNVLKKVAAHYNLEVRSLLDYFCRDAKTMQWMDTDLKEIFQELYSVEDGAMPFGISQSKIDIPLNELFEDEKRPWIEVAIKSTKEEDKYQLLAVLSPSHHTFIRQYAKNLDTDHEQGYLQGKTSGNFKQIKWQFIFAVLFEMDNIAFNKKQFLLRTLTQISNHYHLSLSEILLYFSTEKALSLHSSFKEITSILSELQQEQTHNTAAKNKPVEIVESNLTNDIKINLLKFIGKLTATEQNLFEKLFKQTKFISYSESILRLLPDLLNYLSIELKVKIDKEGLLKFLFGLSANYQTLSRSDILNRLLEWLIKPLANEQKQLLNSYLQQLSQTNYLVNTVVKPLKQKNMEKVENGKFINNAGLVLLSPYYPRLFTMLKLTDNGKFINEEVQIRAMFLLQYAAFGTTEFPEHEMTLNKIMTDFQTGKPIPRNMELTKEEKETVESMLKGSLQHWEKLKNTSIAGLREGFLQREGKLEEKDDCYQLTVQDKAYEMLLDTVPWSFRTIKYPWMKKMINVKWR